MTIYLIIIYRIIYLCISISTSSCDKGIISNILDNNLQKSFDSNENIFHK